MNDIIIPVLSPIRFYDPRLEFDNDTTFQNPDNRLSVSYDWENVNNVPYALPIPRQWPDGQPGIDCIVILDGASDVSSIRADLYDADDALYTSCYLTTWGLIAGSPASVIYRVWLNGNDSGGIDDGYYTIKIIDDDTDIVLMESEMLQFAEWFYDVIPLEFWNFENDFGLIFDDGVLNYSCKMMVPIRMFDPAPVVEKEVYKNDPGVLTTLRTTMQRVFSFDSHPMPAHVAEFVQLGFGCSELYLDRIKINSDEIPEAEIYEGTNLKYITGKATLVDFNDSYFRERVETVLNAETLDWDSSSYAGSIVLNVLTANENPVVVAGAESDIYTYSEGDLVIVKVTLVDDAGDSDLPSIEIDGLTASEQILAWGSYTVALRMTDSATFTVIIESAVNDKAVFTATLDVYIVESR